MSLSRQNILDILNGDMLILTAVYSMYLEYERRHNVGRRRSARRFSINPVNRYRRQQGFYNNLVEEMRLVDTESFVNFHRMSLEVFDELLSMVGPLIQRNDVCEKSISPGQRLSLTLRYLASGDSMVSIGKYAYRIGKSTTSGIIRETCQKLWEVLKTTVFPKPSETMWKEISNQFKQQWNFPHCLGAMDGKHVIIQSFPNSGSINYNYKHSHSVVLFAIADADYKFIVVDIGAPGHTGDSNIFRRSNFGRAVISGGTDLKLPTAECLQDNNEYPFVFVGDEAFPLLPNLMRPFPGRNTSLLTKEKSAFNYRLSRARRVVENAFGILSSRWRIYRRPIIASKTTVLGIIKATVVLHNWLRAKKLIEYVNPDLLDSDAGQTFRPGRWRREESGGMQSIQRVGSNNASRSAVEIREKFSEYFNEVDVLPWQYSSIH